MRLLLVFLLLAFTSFCSAAEVAGLVAFGDSLSDMGNRWLDKATAESKFKQTWVAQLAGQERLNIPNFKPSGTKTYFGGTNYAVGGAGTEFTAKLSGERNRPHNLTAQVSQRYLNPAFNTDGVQKDALHVVVMGTNDLMFASVGMEQILSQWAGIEKVGVSVAQSAESQIQALAAAGVTHILWGSIFNIAQAPSVVARANAFGGGALAPVYLEALTKGAIAHNTEMDLAIARLTAANPSLKITKLDLFAKFAQVAADPGAYGFADVTTGANDNKHLFSSDGLHPTFQGHKMLADFAWEVLKKEGISAKK